MPNWKKVAISGSNISQFNNDGTYIKMNGSTTNGLLTYEATDCASVESNIIYDGNNQKLLNNGKIIAYSGSAFSTSSPPNANGAIVGFKSPLAGAPWSPISGSRNHAISATTRYTSHGSGGQCASTIGINSQRGTSDKNAVVELTSIAKQNGCHDAIFSLGVKADAGAGETFHPVKELFRADGRDETIFLSGSVSIKTSKVSSTASLGSVLVYDNSTGEIKKSSCTPITSDDVSQLSIAGKDSSGNIVSELDTTAITFLCAPTTNPGANNITLKIHSATQTSNQAQIPIPDTNNQLVSCEDFYLCTTDGTLYNNGSGIVIINNNLGAVAEPSTVLGAGVFKMWAGPNGASDAPNQAAPIYNIRSTQIGGYSQQNATASFTVSTAQCTSTSTDNNHLSRIRLTHVDCNNQTFASTDLESISLGTNGSYCETTGFSVNLRGRDQLYYRRLYIESSDTTAANANIILSGSLHVDTTQMNSVTSLANVLVYDNSTGEIKKSSLTPSTGNSAAGNSGNVQYNSGTSCGFAAESSFTYDASTDKLTVKNPGDGTGGLITNNIEGGGNTLVITDGGNDSAIQFCTYGADSLELDDGTANIYGAVHTPDITTTTATDCPSVVISTTGELLAGPVGGAGTTSTLQQVTDSGNTTSNPIIFDGDTTACNLVKATNCTQAASDGIPLKIEGSDNGGATGKGGCIHICAGDATSTGGGAGGDILLKAGVSANSGQDSGYVCVEGKGLVVPDGISSEPGIAFAGDVSMGLWRTSDCVVISKDGTQGTTNHYFGDDGYKICDGALAVGNISLSSTVGRIDASNDVVAYSTSDCRLKKYVKPIKNALDKIDKIRGVEFDWKVTDDKMEKEVHSFEGHDVGVLAQEIEEVLPEVVTTRDSGYKAVRYEKIVPLLIQGIKELKDEVEILKTKI